MVSLEDITSISELRKKYGDKIPHHVGLILDGNRRWIKQQGVIDTLKGHKEGYNTLRKILLPFFDAGVKYLSIYALSTENLEKRYSKVLLNSIKNYWTEANQNRLKLQRETINATYSWDVRSVEWKNFFDEAREVKN